MRHRTRPDGRHDKPSDHRSVFLALMLTLVTACGSGGLDQTLASTAEQGRQVARELGCAACHGPDGEGVDGLGPSWQGLYGNPVTLTDGTVVIADRDYLRQSILEPDARTVAGFTLPMPPYHLPDEQVEAILDYIEEQG